MTNIIMMLLAFLILTGVVCFYHEVLKVNMGEGMVLTASTVMLVLVASSTILGTFRYGMYVIYAVAVLGVLLYLLQMLRQKGRFDVMNSWLVIVILGIIFAVCLVIYHNDFIQHTDEFHQWAAAVKYMLEKDTMPVGADFVGGGGQSSYATSLFYLFFQEIAGYNEANMYVASTLLTFIGFLLPFSNSNRQNLKNTVLYTVIIYIALYSLYSYATKNLYVDMPTAAWAGGLAGWWINRKKTKNNWIILGAGLIVLHFMKTSSGLLMALYVVAFAVGYSWLIDGRRLQKPGMIKKVNMVTVILCILILLGSAGAIGALKQMHREQITVEETGTEEVQYKIGSMKMPQSLTNYMEINAVSMKKVKKTMSSFLTSAFGTPMNGKSNLKVAFVPFMVALVMMFSVYGEWRKKKNEIVFYRNYMLVMSLSYCAVLFFSYIIMFAYNLSVTTRSIIRYLSCCAVFWFMIVLTLFLSDHEEKTTEEKGRSEKYFLCVVLAIFLYGINAKYIPNTTALNKSEVVGYDDIMRVKEQAEAIKAQISSEDKVYFIYQINDEPGKADLVTSPVLYYLDTQISNYGYQPWRFFENGCNMAIEDYTTVTIKDLPYYLQSGNYTYLWIYGSDKYLRNELPGVLNYDGEVDAGLYKIIYENEQPVGLEYVSTL